jgi:inner membrane protein
VDNVAHSLVGLAIAELAQPASATLRERRLLVAAGLVSANLPDIDLAYTWITPAPLGYLLHHRGHTHTLAGLVILGLLFVVLFRVWPAARASLVDRRSTLWWLVGVNLVVHVLLDACNTYGVHPLYPFDARWYYGDAVFIFEPLFWVMLGVAAACNARSRRTRVGVAALVAVLLVLTVVAEVVPAGAAAAVAAAGGLFFAAVRQASSRTRAGAALALVALFIASMFALSRSVKLQASAASTSPGEILDVIATPNPAMPLCWSVIVVSRDWSRGAFRSDRGALSLASSWYHPDRCVSRRLAPATGSQIRLVRNVAWRDDFRDSLSRLPALSRDDCWVAAWLQFGRAPVIRGNLLMDLRFDTGIRRNFTTMPLQAGSGCPPNITSWAPPRGDLLGSGR